MNDESFRIHHMAPYPLGEIAEAVLRARSSGRDVIDLSHVNPTLGLVPEAVDSLVQSALRPHNHRYSASQGITKLREAAARWYQERFGVEVNPSDEVVVTLGTKEAIAHLLLAMLHPGENILVPVPSYPIHNAAVFIAGAGCIGVPLMDEEFEGASESLVLSEESDTFFERLQKILESTWPKPRCMICNFPHNPTGTVVTPGFFSRLVEFAREHAIYILHDFAYADICFDDYRAPSILAAPGAKDVAVEFYSFSKGLGMPGWRVGFCAGNSLLVGALKKIKSYMDSGVFQPLQIAALKALERGGTVVAETVATYQTRRNVLCQSLQEIGWEAPVPQATVFLWMRIPAAARGEGSLAFSRFLLDRAGVAVCPGIGFGVQGEGWVRLAVMEPESRLRLAAQRIAVALESHEVRLWV